VTEPDLSAELDAAEDIVTGRAEAVVTEWGVRSPSGYVTRLGSDEEAEEVARELAEDYEREGNTGAFVRRTVTYGPWEPVNESAPVAPVKEDGGP